MGVLDRNGVGVNGPNPRGQGPQNLMKFPTHFTIRSSLSHCTLVFENMATNYRLLGST